MSTRWQPANERLARGVPSRPAGWVKEVWLLIRHFLVLLILHSLEYCTLYPGRSGELPFEQLARHDDPAELQRQRGIPGR
jgi:hypothetical protein